MLRVVYILDGLPLSDVTCTNISSCSVSCLTLLMLSVKEQKFLMESTLLIIFILVCALGSVSERDSPYSSSLRFFSCYPLRVLSLRFLHLGA